MKLDWLITLDVNHTKNPLLLSIELHAIQQYFKNILFFINISKKLRNYEMKFKTFQLN